MLLLTFLLRQKAPFLPRIQLMQGHIQFIDNSGHFINVCCHGRACKWCHCPLSRSCKVFRHLLSDNGRVFVTLLPLYGLVNSNVVSSRYSFTGQCEETWKLGIEGRPCSILCPTFFLLKAVLGIRIRSDPHY